ncbi:serine/threonine-protein kinase [Actinomadura scrupuli]|uniref:serine/threonine-protein kinase n=1 Tax=Actinomadura scrupuli TaxID=559629 RepID=UPI003D962C1E
MGGVRGNLLQERYRLLTVVGRGGMGTVWRAHDEVLDRDVAVKEVTLPGQLRVGERVLLYHRVLTEARATAMLDHPGVITVHDIVEQDGRPWIVMELVHGSSLQRLIDQDGPLPPHRAAAIGREVLSVLVAAHAAGLLHRDVKPSNVLLAVDGRVVLTDFGLAVHRGEVGARVPLEGSPAYVSPEQASSQPVTEASDLWSLGAMLYAAVEGRPPFARGGALASLMAVLLDPYEPPRHAGGLRVVIDGLLRKDPAERLTADQTARLLARLEARERTGRARMLPRIGALTTVSVLIAAVAAGGTWSSRWTSVGSSDTVRLREMVVAAGLAGYREAAGYSVGIPLGWRRTVRTDGIYWSDPSMRRYIRIAPAAGDPLEGLLAAARHSRDARYRTVRLEATGAPPGGGAEWEYTAPGTHALRSRLAGYDLLFVAPEDRWTPSVRVLDDILRTFRG